MRNPLDHMMVRNNHSLNVVSREISETHNVYGHGNRVDARTHHKRGHYGWDLLADEGTPVFAIADGTIVRAWFDKSRADSSYGYQIELEFQHEGVRYTAFYAHLSDIFVSPMATVSEGKVIGATGHTGNAHNLKPSQYHLHFEIRTRSGDGKHGSIDPSRLLGGQILTCHA